MREPLYMSTRRRVDLGITPACAGTTRSYLGSGGWSWDHPRVCGNHYSSSDESVIAWDHPRVCGNHRPPFLFSALPVGSPPRVREPLCVLELIYVVAGITPACAGTTRSRVSTRTSIQDHPRVCGNHVSTSGMCQETQGSPPRVREPRGSVIGGTVAAGITPACAGTTR